METITLKILPTIALLYQVIDCAGKALGVSPQYLFAENVIWVWWIASLGWAIATIAFAVNRYE